MRLTRRAAFSAFLTLLLAPPAALFLSGCPGSPSDKPQQAADTSAGGTKSGDASEAATPPSAAKTIKAGLVTDVGGINDRSFNQSAWEGMQRAQKELGAEIKYTESRQLADYVPNLTQYARSGYDVVFAVGFLMQDALKEVAPRFPNVKFAIIDGDAPDLPNCVSYKFREEEGSFLAGALAGLVTKTKTICFVGGMEMPLIKKFEAGYRAGALTTNPQVKVVTGYAGVFNDPQKGQEIAISQMGAKADIIYHAAGSTGIGVIKAVQAKGTPFYAIGVDKDQDGDAPGAVLTSMVKRVDVAVFDVCKSVAENSFKGGAVNLGLKENGVGLSEMKYTKQAVPAKVLETVEKLKQQIIAEKLKPPTTLEELKTFEAPPVQ